ncbi:MAG: CvpA family protein, partial [Actinomycetota bacterium]
MNALDWVIAVLLVLSLATGFRRGAALQLLTYSGLIGGLVIGAVLAPRVAGLARDPFAQAGAALLTLLLLAAVGDALGWLVGRRVWAAARRSRLDPVDAGAGSVIA